MSLIKSILKSIVTWGIAVLFIILIILLPRDVLFEKDPNHPTVFKDVQYVYSFGKHMEAIEDFFVMVFTHGTLGNYSLNLSIADIVAQSIHKSLLIILPALVFGFMFGVGKGVLDYQLANRKWSILGKGSTWLFLSIPDFFIVISIQLGLMFLYEKGLFFHVDVLGSDKLDNLVLATIFLMIYPLFYIAKVVSTQLESEERKDYIRTAKSKGTPYKRILYKHVLWNCWAAILTHLTTISLYMLSNLFIIEKFMGYKGAGYYFFQSVAPGALVHLGGGRDLAHANMAIAFSVLFTLFILIVNIMSQIMIFKLDKTKEV